jgi:hypothetical protein
MFGVDLASARLWLGGLTGSRISPFSPSYGQDDHADDDDDSWSKT